MGQVEQHTAHFCRCAVSTCDWVKKNVEVVLLTCTMWVCRWCALLAGRGASGEVLLVIKWPLELGGYV